MFQASPNLISLYDFETKRSVDVNDSFTKITGYLRAEAINTTINELNIFIDLQKAEDGINLLEQERSVKDIELKILTKSGEERILLCSGEVIEIAGKEYGLIVAEDITDRKEAELELKRRLMKYDLEDGNLYLIKEGRLNKVLEAFNDLLRVGYSGIILSRTDIKLFERNLDHPFEFVWLSDIHESDSILINSNKLELWANSIPRGSAILIDRLDYIISKVGTKNINSFIQRLHDLAFINNHIILINADPKLIDNKELTAIEKESLEMEPMVKLSLPDDLLEILRFVYDNNIAGMKPKYARIQNELNLSKPTVRKRLKELLTRGLILESTKGSSKVVELTDKGKALFLK
jgi:PAS domain S-box-containing protein